MGYYLVRLLFSLVLTVPTIMLTVLGVQEWLATHEAEGFTQSTYQLAMWLIPAAVFGAVAIMMFRSASQYWDR